MLRPMTDDDEGAAGDTPNDMKSDQQPPERMIGRVLGGQYRIEGHLGSGGFGDVFRAVQEKTEQVVALKVLKPRYGKGAPSMARQLARFRREMRVCAELHHPHIVRLIDSGETERGLLFSVFEYVPGTTLAELLREKGSLTVRMTIELMGQVLDALICAHGRGIIHRDLKPNNIMVSTTGSRAQTTILDFGISAFVDGMLIDEFRNLTVTREVLGTPAYAAPEQLRGETPSVKSDLYAWGLVFLECILGRRVFDGASSMEVAHRQLSAESATIPQPLQDHWLGTLLRWVIEKDVNRRAGDASLVLERLTEKRPIGNLVNASGFFVEDDAGKKATVSSVNRVDPVTPSVSISERRQVTALCCTIGVDDSKMTGSTELLDHALRDAQQLCLHVARRFGGFPAGNLGGQVLVYFGFPKASDADARCSAIVALEIAHELRRRNETATIPIEVRIGVHTGVVMTPVRQQRPSSPVFGVTPSRASQLAIAAPANAIFVSHDTQPYLASSFELRAASTMRGETIYELVAERRAESTPAGSSRAPFVGRAAELELLRTAWMRAQKGRGGAVVILGEAGIGKSRLAREFRQSMEHTGSRWIEARCLPEMHNSALHPIIDLVNQELDLGSSDEGTARLEAQLKDFHLASDAAVPLLASWLGLNAPELREPLQFSPQRQRTLALELFVNLVVAISDRQAAPVVIEDLHWADPTTLEFVDLLVRRVARTRCLLLLTSRPDTGSKWPPELVKVLELESLGPADVTRMVEGLAGRVVFSEGMLQEVVERADGIPLFAEELVRFLTDGPPAGEGTGRPPHDVPASLRDLLTGRLDRLGQATDTAQVAAAIGREFDYRLLARVVGGDEARLLADLEKMVSADLLIRRRAVDKPMYMFRHALIRDAAYESLMQKSRQQLHRRIVEVMADAFPELAEAHPEVMASHYELAALVPQAIDEGLRAGRRALDRAANREAIAHLRHALGLLAGISDPTERMRRELELQVALSPALMAIQGWASPDNGVACARARDLCRALSDDGQLFPALWGLWTFQFVGGDLEPAMATAQQTLSMAEQHQRSDLAIPAHHALGFTHLFRAEFDRARHHADLGLALYDPVLEREIARRSQLSSTSACSYFRAASLWQMGYPDDAENELSRTYRIIEELGHPPSTAAVMGFYMILHQYQQDVARVRTTANQLYALSKEQGFETWLAMAFVFLAWLRAKDGEVERGIAELRQGIGIFRGVGARLTLVGMHAILGEALLLADRPAESIATLEDGILEAETRLEHQCEPELHRLRGEALARLGAAGAEASLMQALLLARQQGARMMSLRAAVSLARQWGDGRRDEAQTLLKDEYGWFTQGFDTPDLRQARAQLTLLERG